MNTESKSGDKDTRDPFECLLDSCKINPLEAALYKYNLDAFIKLCEDTSQNIIKYYKGYSSLLDKYIGNMKEGIDILPANGHDICNYVARHNIGSFQIQAIMKLDGRLDFDKLRRAVRLSVDAEPVFGCRFVEDDPPYWKRLSNLDEISFCSLEEADNPDEAVIRFLQGPMDMDMDPKVMVKLIRSEQYDVLGIKVNHACCDGTGTKEYIQLLSEIYGSIDRDNGTFIPKPRIGGRKDQDKLFDELGISFPELKWNPVLETPKTAWTFPWKQRGGNTPCFAISRLPQGSLESIHEFGKARGATVNDLILTAFYRTMFKISRPMNGIPMDISSTIDLRRYLPGQKTEAIRNFSGGFVTHIARIKDESFEDTLSRVVHATKKIKDRRPGLNNAMAGEYVEKTNFTYFNNYLKIMSHTPEIASQYTTYASNICYPGLSNLGYISGSPVKFGKNTVIDAYIVPPAIRAPGFLLLASSYSGVLTLSTGYYKDSVRRKDMEGLLCKIKNELIRGCTSEN